MDYCDYNRGKAECLSRGLRTAVDDAVKKTPESIKKYKDFAESTICRVKAYINAVEKKMWELDDEISDPDLDAYRRQCRESEKDRLRENKQKAETELKKISTLYPEFAEVESILKKLQSDIEDVIEVIYTEENIMHDAANLKMSGKVERNKIRRVWRQ